MISHQDQSMISLQVFSEVSRKAYPVEEGGGGEFVFTYFSPDGDEGYPGNVNVTVTFSLDASSRFSMKVCICFHNIWLCIYLCVYLCVVLFFLF